MLLLGEHPCSHQLHFTQDIYLFIFLFSNLALGWQIFVSGRWQLLEAVSD